MEKELNKYGILNSLISVLNEGAEDTADVNIAKYLLQNFNRLQELNIYDIASECFVSRATIRRFSKKMGFDNFKDLKGQFINFHDTYLFYRSGIYENSKGQPLIKQLVDMAQECESFLTEERMASIVSEVKNTI